MTFYCSAPNPKWNGLNLSRSSWVRDGRFPTFGRDRGGGRWGQDEEEEEGLMSRLGRVTM